MDRKAKGKLGEEIARQHYKKLGYEILEVNYRYQRAEIDLIVLKDEMLLVFVEAKLRSRSDYGEAESFVSKAQQERIKDAAEEYLHCISWKKDIRFDIVIVDTKGMVEVFEDAF